jgi:hypothetical protein
VFTNFELDNAKKCSENTYAKDVYSRLVCKKVNNVPTWYITLTDIYSNMLTELNPVVFCNRFKDACNRFTVKIEYAGNVNRVYLVNNSNYICKYIYSCESEYTLCMLISLLPFYGVRFISKYNESWGFLYG